MSSEPRRWLPVLLALALCACGIRNLELDVHAPATCEAETRDGGADCPLGAVRSFETILERVDGTRLDRECMPVEGTVCTYEDLSGFLFLRRSPATDGVEIFVTGWTEPGCDGGLAMSCESFGDGVIDLEQAQSVPLWCDCPRIAP
ncbi:MAG TPA: hypothetical protein RMH99_32650 [Sandaracinaceae bacterium LLY-WYZ-13_1]|nr:hypothetical protein [Sandaracinaceae bacterium LLY-WYZ-13_1]